MGFLSSTEVIECAASDLEGQYVGQTGPKTKKLFEKALGRVLFIDEAYRLGEGHYGKEAMDEMVGILTQPAFKGKLIVVLAGYDREMDDLLAVNTGLSSRFPEEILFRNMSPEQCLEVLRRKLKKDSVIIDALESPASPEYLRMRDLLQELSSLPSFGNARDMETLSRQLMGIVFSNPGSADNSSSDFYLASDQAIACIETMLSERQARTSRIPNQPSVLRGPPGPLAQQQPPPLSPPPAPMRTAPPVIKQERQPPRKQRKKSDQQAGRDPDVSDEVWRQLQDDKRAAQQEEKRERERLALLEKERREAEEREERARVEEERLRLAEAKAKDEAERAELMRRREQERLKAAREKEERDRIRAAQEAAMEEEKRKKKEEARVQQKLRDLGICPAGFRWVKQAGGYRCTAGGHFVPNSALGI